MVIANLLQFNNSKYNYKFKKKLILLPLIFLLSCSPIFIQDTKLNNLWIGKYYSEIIDILGPYSREIEDLSNPENKISKVFSADTPNAFSLR